MYPIIVAGMDIRNTLLRDIDLFLAERQMAETTFGKLAMNDGKFVSRIRAGSDMTISTYERVRAFMAQPAASDAA